VSDPAIVIVGAGPAGIRAAEALARQGLRPTLIDEAPKGGGQIYRQAPERFRRPASSRYGFEAGKAQALHRTIDRLASVIDYRPSTLAWNVWDRGLHTLSAGRVGEVAFDFLVVATGAMDRILPIPGWTLPGVYALGGAQIALKYQGCAIGRRTVFLGTGPLLYLVAYQYAKAGAEIGAVLDTSPAAAKRRALATLASSPATLAKGVYYRAWLAARGILVEEGVTPLAISGDTRVHEVAYRRLDREKTVRCDAVGLGFGLKAETQLADLAGCRFRFDDQSRQWLPERSADGEGTASGVYLAGDGAGIGGADAAELWGERVGLAIGARCGRAPDAARLAIIDRRLARLGRFRAGLDRAFPLPSQPVSALAGDTVLCRCEGVRVGEAKAAIRDWSLVEMNRMKAVTRIGMGRCQGRICGLAAAELLAAETGRDLAAVGRLRGQPPVKPMPIPWSGGP
jgi:NADPH-dependent 2,4-dienoyl-CoA reductase/sulfur reductase-like enzyme